MASHVLLVVPVGGVGGVQTHVADLAHGLVQHGMQVTVAAGSEGAMVERLRALGIPVVLVAMRRRTDVQAMRDLLRLIRVRAVDLVHTHSPLGGVIGRHAALAARVPAVHTLHGLGILDEFRRSERLIHRLKLLSYRWHERWLNARTAAIIAPSPSIAEAAVRCGHVARHRITVIPHGVDLPASSSDHGTAEIVYAGRLHAEKGVDVLIDAFAQVHRDEPDVRLALAGDGPMRGLIERRIAEAGLSGVARILGEVDDVRSVLRGVACLALPSRAEGLSYVLLEAMALGIACVATAVGGTPDVIEDGRNGILVPADDAAALARAMLAVLRDPGRAAAMGAAARETISTRYQRPVMIDRTRALYHSVLERDS